jgi:hypothetical protein
MAVKTRTNNKGINKKDKRNAKTMKYHSNKYSHQHIVRMFLCMLNTVKLFHWKTHSFAQHKATDELYSNLNSTIDTFVETMLGKTGTRVNLTGTRQIPLLDCHDISTFKREVKKYKEYLIHMKLNDSSNTDLLNTRDEMLGHLNQFSYLLTFH